MKIRYGDGGIGRDLARDGQYHTTKQGGVSNIDTLSYQTNVCILNVIASLSLTTKIFQSRAHFSSPCLYILITSYMSSNITFVITESGSPTHLFIKR